MEQFPREVIEQQLHRMLCSSVFRRKPRLSDFLRYVVSETLNGSPYKLKEYSIATAVFGRPDDFDPRLDSIVRVEARRLRATVDMYYSGEGSQDTLLIRFAKGHYVPTFEERPADAVPAFAQGAAGALGGSLLIGVFEGDPAVASAKLAQGQFTLLRAPLDGESRRKIDDARGRVFLLKAASSEELDELLNGE